MVRGLFGWFNRRPAQSTFDCDDVKDNCSDYVDAEMPNEQLSKFESHMNECPDCGTFVKTFRAIVLTVRDFADRKPADDLKKRIQDRISSEGDNSAN
jgi:anti-sigma factor RsiW